MYFPCPRPGTGLPCKCSGPCQWRMTFRNQDLGAVFVHCCQYVRAELGNEIQREISVGRLKKLNINRRLYIFIYHLSIYLYTQIKKYQKPRVHTDNSNSSPPLKNTLQPQPGLVHISNSSPTVKTWLPLCSIFFCSSLEYTNSRVIINN